MFCGVADSDGANDFPVIQGVDLARVAGDPRCDQGIGGKGHRLRVTLAVHVEGICRLSRRDEVRGTSRAMRIESDLR